MDRPGCSLALPYPRPAVEGENNYYAQLLMDDYSGYISEFSAISLYSFQHFSAEDSKYESYAELVKCISIVEMHHMELLAETIFKLGITPKYRGSYSTMNHFWNGSFIRYRRNLTDMLDMDIQSEIDAIRQYKYHISIVRDKNIQDLLNRIILDEEKHLELFEQERFKLNR
jgi:bacterioferritin